MGEAKNGCGEPEVKRRFFEPDFFLQMGYEEIVGFFHLISGFFKKDFVGENYIVFPRTVEN